MAIDRLADDARAGRQRDGRDVGLSCELACGQAARPVRPRWRRAVGAALLAVAGSAFGQAPVTPVAASPASAAPMPAQRADLFDFWVGDWDLRWINADGSVGQGRNRIDKILDGAVIEEKFEEVATGSEPVLKGHSLTVLNKAAGVWRQAWADNQGGFFALTAQVDGDRRILMTDVVRTADKATAQRMVFHSIGANALTWDWEGTADGGATWKRLWRIEYKRRGSS